MKVTKLLSELPEEDKTPLVLQLFEVIQLQTEEIQVLKDEIARLKGQKPKPDIKPSKLERQKRVGFRGYLKIFLPKRHVLPALIRRLAAYTRTEMNCCLFWNVRRFLCIII